MAGAQGAPGARLFRTRTRAEWCERLEGTDVCFAPVLTMTEAAEHPHNVARGTFVDVDGVTQPAPAPRFSRTPAAIDRPPARPGEHTREVLADWGVDAARIDALHACRRRRVRAVDLNRWAKT